jgi:tRNA threonylcarbamoyladenosine biosynthesis protein TsaB
MCAVLALSTCTPQLEVALAFTDRSGPPSVVRLTGTAPRSSLLLAAVDLVVEESGIEPGDIGRVVVTRGPGSFTGIRAALATAAGINAATGAEVLAYDSLLVQAVRAVHRGTVWTAQPGRRGEVYARPFSVTPGRPPRPLDELVVMRVIDLARVGPWLASEALDLGDAVRATAGGSAVEAALRLLRLEVPSDPVTPLYVEGPPIHRGDG